MIKNNPHTTRPAFKDRVQSSLLFGYTHVGHVMPKPVYLHKNKSKTPNIGSQIQSASLFFSTGAPVAARAGNELLPEKYILVARHTKKMKNNLEITWLKTELSVSIVTFRSGLLVSFGS